MALNMSLLGCLILACALNFVNAQTLSESVFKQLSAAELRDISLMQNPMLLDLAARTGESVTVIISAAEQGAIVQESVNTILDCTEWASNFPGGTIMWYKYTYNDLDHTDLGARTPQIPDLINNAQIPRATIRGDFYQIYEIIRAIISMDAEDSSRGIYECEVCIARGIPAFEVCHSANTTVATAGRPPIIDEGTGRDPGPMNDYKIGQTICLFIDEVDPLQNVPEMGFVSLRCGDVGAVNDADGNPVIPSAIPSSTFTWRHTSLDGRAADFAVNRTQTELTSMYMPPLEYFMTFPELANSEVLAVSTLADPDAITFLFSFDNITRRSSEYPALREAFGVWKCTLQNDLGMDMAATLITDNCGVAVPSISEDCSDLGPPVGDNVYIVDDTLDVPVVAGCSVCVSDDSAIALTLTCPTNVASFPNITIVSREWTKDGVVLSEDEDVTVMMPGDYTCEVDFSGQGSDSATTTISFIPDVQIEYMRGDSTTSGCDRLKVGTPFPPEFVCIFFSEGGMTTAEPLNISCITDQEGVTAVPIDVATGMIANQVVITDRSQDMTMIRCDILNSPPDVNDDCAVDSSLTVLAFAPATILVDFTDTCTTRAGQLYSPEFVNEGQTVVLCCFAIGYPDPLVNWTRIVQDPSGVSREESIINNARYTVDPIENSLTIMNYNETLDAGTFVCRASNIAGNDVASAAITSRMPVATFQVSEWSECEPNCRDGVRTRSVWCERDGVVIPDVMCCVGGIVKPPTSEGCANVPGIDICFLTPLWKTGEYSACSSGCSGGVRYREVYCALPLDGSRVHNDRCFELYGAENKPPSYDICYNRCCVVDIYPTYCQASGTAFCDNPVYQQNCCWTCGLTEFE